MTAAIVFAGPSVPPRVKARFGDVTFRQPARQGDVYLALRDRPKVIGIIDGYFDAVPSVWHKEVLWAMSNGVHVLGASSIGALRAAELDSFGMEGVGAVYEAYARGRIEDDDEVAVTHGPAELGFRPLTLAMVSIRATLDTVASESLQRSDSLWLVREAAKALDYRERTLPRIVDSALEKGGHREDVEAIAAHLGESLVDVKAADAERLLTTLRSRADDFTEPKAVRYEFSDTQAWRTFVAWAEDQP